MDSIRLGRQNGPMSKSGLPEAPQPIERYAWSSVEFGNLQRAYDTTLAVAIAPAPLA